MRALACAVPLMLVAACGGSASCPSDLPTACPAVVPSYTDQVHGIIAAQCAPCHQAGGVEASRPLDTYAQLYAQRSSVLNQVYACRMPQSPQSLSAEDRATLMAWLVCDAPQN